MRAPRIFNKLFLVRSRAKFIKNKFENFRKQIGDEAYMFCIKFMSKKVIEQEALDKEAKIKK